MHPPVEQPTGTLLATVLTPCSTARSMAAMTNRLHRERSIVAEIMVIGRG